MTYDFEIYRTANSLLRKHGSLAPLIAAEGADAQKENGDVVAELMRTAVLKATLGAPPLVRAAAAGVPVCDVCREPADVLRADRDTETFLCARHLLISNPPIGQAYVRWVRPKYRPTSQLTAFLVPGGVVLAFGASLGSLDATTWSSEWWLSVALSVLGGVMLVGSAASGAMDLWERWRDRRTARR
jgi:hypothetical protein